MDLPHILAVWLHALALVIVLGYYGILGRVVLPALTRSLPGPEQAISLVAIERRALPLIVFSVVLFSATGAYLLVIDPSYAGLGDFFASTWTTLMLVKHLLVIGLVVVGVYIDRVVGRVGAASSDGERASALHRLEFSAEAATGLGAITILLTATAQVVA